MLDGMIGPEVEAGPNAQINTDYSDLLKETYYKKFSTVPKVAGTFDGYAAKITRIERQRKPEDEREGIKDLLTDEERKKLFESPVQAMTQLAAKYGIALPDDLISRVHLVDQESFGRINAAENVNFGVDSEAIARVHGLNRITLLNKDQISIVSQREGLPFDEVMVGIGVHELWHSAAYMENWDGRDDVEPTSSTHPARRGGIFLTPFRPDDVSTGLWMINEGFSDYLKRETLKLMGEETRYTTYSPELKIVDLLIKEIGAEPFFQAYFNENGIRILSDTLNEKLGDNNYAEEHILRQLARDLNTDLKARSLMYKEDKRTERSIAELKKWKQYAINKQKQMESK